MAMRKTTPFGTVYALSALGLIASGWALCLPLVYFFGAIVFVVMPLIAIIDNARSDFRRNK